MKPARLLWGLVLGCVISLTAQAQTTRESTIRVSGEAVVNVKPDKIIVSMGVETWDKNLAEAKKQNDDILKRAQASIRQSGVAASAIETDILQISPTWVNERDRDDNLRTKSIRGYDINNRFSVTVNDATKVEDVVTRALGVGVNTIYGISFQSTRFKELREQARDMALKAAREKAQKMAAALGQSIGDVVLINENSSNSGMSRMFNPSQNVALNIANDTGDELGSDSISLGKIAIRANVDVVFALRK